MTPEAESGIAGQVLDIIRRLERVDYVCVHLCSTHRDRSVKRTGTHVEVHDMYIHVLDT